MATKLVQITEDECKLIAGLLTKHQDANFKLLTFSRDMWPQELVEMHEQHMGNIDELIDRIKN